MKRKPYSQRKRTTAKSVLRLPDLEHAKAAVLNSLTSLDAQRGYRHAIDEFVDWYCSEPRLALNRIVVLRYRSHLESRQLAPASPESVLLPGVTEVSPHPVDHVFVFLVRLLESLPDGPPGIRFGVPP